MSDNNTKQSTSSSTRRIGFLLGIGILFMPYIFSWLTLRKRYSSFSRVIAFGWLGLVFLVTALSPKKLETQTLPTATSSAPETASSSIVSSPSPPKFLGSHPSGYSLWLGSDDCIYVKDLKQSDLQRNGTTLDQFKQAIKSETGAQCVFLL